MIHIDQVNSALECAEPGEIHAPRKRITMLLMGVMIMGSSAVFADDRPGVTVLIEGTANQNSIAILAVVPPGGVPSPPYFNVQGNLSSGMTALQARDALVPVAGSTGSEFEIQRVMIDGVPGFRVNNNVTPGSMGRWSQPTIAFSNGATA